MREIHGFRGSPYGEVFVALDKKSNDLVAMKRLKPIGNVNAIETELQWLKECQSRYTVRYYNVVRKENELWVGRMGFR